MNWHGVAIWFGLTKADGHAYLLWSGAGSDLGELAIVGGLVSMARAANCHVKGCWRLGGHQVTGTPYKVCRKHHPEVPHRVNVEHVEEAHSQAMRTDSM